MALGSALHVLVLLLGFVAENLHSRQTWGGLLPVLQQVLVFEVGPCVCGPGAYCVMEGD